MIRVTLLITTFFVVQPLLSQDASAQGHQAADSTIDLPTEWSTYYVVLLKDGEVSADELGADTLRAIMGRHVQYQLRLQRSGDALAGGGFGQSTDGVIGLTLLRAKSLDEAKQLAQKAPPSEQGGSER